MSEAPPIPGLFMVDDNALAAEAPEHSFPLTGLLRRLGWCPKPVAAVQVIVKLRPHVVLLDVEIRDADYFSLSRAVISQCPSARVVMFSGHAHAALVDHAMQQRVTEADPFPDDACWARWQAVLTESDLKLGPLGRRKCNSFGRLRCLRALRQAGRVVRQRGAVASPLHASRRRQGATQSEDRCAGDEC